MSLAVIPDKPRRKAKPTPAPLPAQPETQLAPQLAPQLAKPAADAPPPLRDRKKLFIAIGAGAAALAVRGVAGAMIAGGGKPTSV